MTSNAALDWLSSHESESVARLCDWLRIPSISTDPAYKADCQRAAEWAGNHLAESGFEVEIRPTGSPDGAGHPIVIAKSEGAADYTGPHVLFYGHYDVQPADPLELWESPPFEPVIKPAEGVMGERVVARGAVDDKGQTAMFLEAMRALKEASGSVGGGVRYTVLLEGEEESGSENLEAFIEKHAAELKQADVCVISDTGMLGRGKPAITYGLRGLAYTEVTLHGPSHDLHSGMWGGKLPNPNNELVRILGQLWDADRRVVLPGFYDSVRDIEPAEREAWSNLGVDEAEALKGVGLPPESNVGEKGYSMTEREWARPTCEINGLYGGYTAEGAKTVIPAHASAKISFRLVADQEPSKVRDALFAWLEERTPPGCRWDFKDHGGGFPATVPTESPTLNAAARAIERASGVMPALIKSGGSIPVAGMVKQHLGLDTVMMGFGLEDDRMHSPNEKFELDCFRMGARSHLLLTEELREL